MASLDEIETSYHTAKRNGSKDITLLYCVSNYPSKQKDFNLNNINILKNKFKCRVGLSDHSTDNKIARAAIAAGAEVIEKHIALENQKNGLDIEFSIKGNEINSFRKAIDETYQLLGKKYFYRNKTETKNKIFRRSIFAVEKILKGEKFTKKNIKRIRPGNGLPPENYEKLLNKISPITIPKATPLSKKILEMLDIN